jgi:hypothetical protein
VDRPDSDPQRARHLGQRQRGRVVRRPGQDLDRQHERDPGAAPRQGGTDRRRRLSPNHDPAGRNRDQSRQARCRRRAVAARDTEHHTATGDACRHACQHPAGQRSHANIVAQNGRLRTSAGT